MDGERTESVGLITVATCDVGSREVGWCMVHAQPHLHVNLGTDAAQSVPRPYMHASVVHGCGVKGWDKLRTLHSFSVNMALNDQKCASIFRMAGGRLFALRPPCSCAAVCPDAGSLSSPY